MITLMWFVKSLDTGSPEEGFKALNKEDVKTEKGAAFWSQVCGGYNGIAADKGGALSGGGGLRSEALLILSNKKWKLPCKGTAQTWNAIKNSCDDGYYYLGLQKVFGTEGGHAIGLYVNGGAFVLMDPNHGIVVDLIGLTGISTVLNDMWTKHTPGGGCTVYKVEAE